MSVAMEVPDDARPRAGVPVHLVIIAAGSLAGGIIGLLFALGNGADGLFPGFAFGAIIGLLGTLLGVDQWIGSRRYRLAQIVPIDRDDVQLHAARWFGGPPWILSRQQPGELVFWRRLDPNLLTALLLFALGVLPGVFYVLATLRATQTLALRMDPDPDGTDLEILVQPQGYNGRRAVNRFYNALHDL